jgi:hypothetical protein
MVWSEHAAFALECFPNDPLGLGILALVSESLPQDPFCDEIRDGKINSVWMQRQDLVELSRLVTRTERHHEGN